MFSTQAQLSTQFQTTVIARKLHIQSVQSRLGDGYLRRIPCVWQTHHPIDIHKHQILTYMGSPRNAYCTCIACRYVCHWGGAFSINDVVSRRRQRRHWQLQHLICILRPTERHYVERADIYVPIYCEWWGAELHGFVVVKSAYYIYLHCTSIYI